jgi:hypothetical protein
MHLLEYQNPATKPRRLGSWGFLLAFAVSYVPGVLVLDCIDDVVLRYLSGHHNDGGIMTVSVMCSPVIALIVGTFVRAFPKFRTAVFAFLSAVFLPILLYFLWISASLLIGA